MFLFFPGTFGTSGRLFHNGRLEHLYHSGRRSTFFVPDVCSGREDDVLQSERPDDLFDSRRPNDRLDSGRPEDLLQSGREYINFSLGRWRRPEDFSSMDVSSTSVILNIRNTFFILDVEKNFSVLDVRMTVCSRDAQMIFSFGTFE